MRYVLYALAVLAAVIAFMVYRTVRFTKKDGEDLPALDTSDRVSDQEIADHLAALIQCATVSNADPSLVDWSEFDRLHRVLEELYPNVHRVMEKEIIGSHNLLFRWKGTDPQARPIALLAHQDVVPIGDESAWTHGPFSGEDDGEMIWGRGACDMKNHFTMVLDACERLINEGY
ncbi:MAG: M20/M25/M40 family metallo-hydrolase, partial [Oscillospiraceae bacterium]|nr:M20/M25/M40 family metallo-hydrolase [Oscillospiraceae bacterium]